MEGIKQMADRIFPSAKQDSLGSEKQINTIDWDAFAKSFRTAAEGDDEEGNNEEVDVNGMSDSDLESAIKKHMDNPDMDMREFCEKCPDDSECKPHCEEWLDRNPEEEDEGDEEEAPEEPTKEPTESKMKDLEDHFKKNPDNLGKLKGGLKDYMEKKLHGKKDDKSDKNDKGAKVVRAKDVKCEKCAGKGCDACWDMKKKKASNEGRVIVFNHPNEISAEALMAAKASNDDVKVRAILAARETRNRVIEAKLETLASEEVAKAQKLAQRREYRESIIAQADANAKRLAQAEAKVVTKKSSGYKTVSAMQIDEKQVVAQRLIENGFPKEYVDATLGLNQVTASEISEAETEIREVLSSDLSETRKRTVVASLVKVAELSTEQLDRCIRFWVDELGYGDEQWVRDLFSKR